MLWLALAGWLAWCAAQLALMLVTSYVMRPNVPCFTGFAIVVPPWAIEALSLLELEAIIAHERGHRRCLHVWTNFALTCAFLRPSPALRAEQEIEADEFAIGMGYGLALDSARATLRQAIIEGKAKS